MQRIYGNPALARRMHASTAVIVFAFLFGIWELWSASQAGPEGSGYGYLFALLFIGGGIYAMRQLLTDHADTVVAVDADQESGRGVVFVWRPFQSKRIAGDLDRLSNWRFEVVSVRSNQRVPMLLVDHPENPRPLRLELGKGISVSDALKKLAPKAVAAFERKGV